MELRVRRFWGFECRAMMLIVRWFGLFIVGLMIMVLGMIWMLVPCLVIGVRLLLIRCCLVISLRCWLMVGGRRLLMGRLMIMLIIGGLRRGVGRSRVGILILRRLLSLLCRRGRRWCLSVLMVRLFRGRGIDVSVVLLRFVMCRGRSCRIMDVLGVGLCLCLSRWCRGGRWALCWCLILWWLWSLRGRGLRWFCR